MRTTLLTAVRTTILADSDPVRQALFAGLRATSTVVRAICWLHGRLGRTTSSALLVAMYGIKSWLTIGRAARASCHLVAVAVHANARRRVEEVAFAYGAQHVCYLHTGVSALLHPSNVGRIARLVLPTWTVRRAFRLIRIINERHDFLVSCRVASLLGCYARSQDLLSTSRPLGVLVSSDSNPEEVGLVAAARSLSIPTVFVSHAYTTSVSPRLNFSLSILEGQAAIEAYSRKGPVQGTVFLSGVEGVSKSMDPSRLRRPKPIIGIFAPKVIVWPVFSAMIDDCRQHFRARQIVIRWHPSMIGRPELAKVLSDASDILETPRTATLLDVATLCDWVVADASSNVHLPVLKLGVPTVALNQIGALGDDQADIYGFVANRVVFPPVKALRTLPIEEVVAFYGPAWTERFQRYDASYLQPDHLVMKNLAHALQVALGDHRPAQAEAGK